MEMKKTMFDSYPSLISYEGKEVRINFDVEEVKVEDSISAGNNDAGSRQKSSPRIAYSAYVVRVEQPIDRDKIVDAIVSSVYPSDRMQAIINNHFLNLATIADGGELDADEQEHEQEYLDMQAWRKKAKETAKDVLSDYLSNL